MPKSKKGTIGCVNQIRKASGDEEWKRESFKTKKKMKCFRRKVLKNEIVNWARKSRRQILANSDWAMVRRIKCRF